MSLMPSVRRLQVLAVLCGAFSGARSVSSGDYQPDAPEAFEVTLAAEADSTDRDVRAAQDALRQAHALENANREELRHESAESQEVQNRTAQELEDAQHIIASAVSREQRAAAEQLEAEGAETRAEGDERAADGEWASSNATLEHADREMVAARGRAAEAASARANASAEMEVARAMERNTSQEQWASAQQKMRQAHAEREQVRVLHQQIADERSGNLLSQVVAGLAAVVAAGAAVYLSLALQRERGKRVEHLQVIKKLSKDRRQYQERASNGVEEPLLQS